MAQEQQIPIAEKVQKAQEEIAGKGEVHQYAICGRAGYAPGSTKLSIEFYVEAIDMSFKAGGNLEHASIPVSGNLLCAKPPCPGSQEFLFHAAATALLLAFFDPNHVPDKAASLTALPLPVCTASGSETGTWCKGKLTK